MNYSRAVRNKLRLMITWEHIHSAAETELRRSLTKDEVSSLTSKFHPEKIVSCIDTVLKEILIYFANQVFLKYGYGCIRFLLLLCRKKELKCFFSPKSTPRDGNCLFHGKLFEIKKSVKFHVDLIFSTHRWN